MCHIADELGAIQPCSAADLAALATVLVGSIEPAQRSLRQQRTSRTGVRLRRW
jgi:hypothetical protein